MFIRTANLSNSSGAARTGTVVALAVILAVTAVFFQPVLRAGFTNWDDDTHLINNTSLRSLDPQHFQTIFSTTVNKTYIPLTIFSFALENYFFGFDPFVYHLDNLLLHLAVVSLVFLLGRRMGLRLFGASFAALLFALHPMHVESVAWVSARKDGLYSVFYLLALLSYWRYLREYHWFSYVLSLLFTFLSMLAKPMALSLPLMLLVCDWFGGRRFHPRVFLEKLPHVAIVLPIAWVTYSLHVRLPQSPVWEAMHIWLWTLTFYIEKFFLPLESVPLYQLPRPVSLFNVAYAQSLMIFFLTALALVRFRREKWPVFAAAYYFFSIFFLLRFDASADMHIVADRFMYLPSVGICLALGGMFEKVFHDFERKGSMAQKTFHFSMILFFLTLGAKTFMQTKVWTNSFTLWNYVIHTWPEAAKSYVNRGTAYLEVGQWDKAIEDFNRALALRPDLEKVYQNRAVAYVQKGLYEQALEDLGRELQRNSRDGEAYRDRGNVYQKMGDLDKAMEDYRRALRLRPDDAQVDMNIGNVYGVRGELQKALEFYDEALKKDPLYVYAYHNKGVAYEKLGEDEKALAAFTRAIGVEPHFADSYSSRAGIYLRRREYGPALADYTEALRLNPSALDARYHRGIIYQQLGKFDEAVADFSYLVNAAPGYLPAYFQRADIYRRRGERQKAIEDYSAVLRMDPGIGEAYYLRGTVYGEDGQWEKALDDLRNARKAGFSVDKKLIQDIELRINGR